MSSEDKMPLRRENTLAPLEKVPEELMDKVVEHAEAKRVADLPIIDRVKEGIEDVTTQISSQVGSLKEAVTSSNTENQEENKKEPQEAQEKPEQKESQKSQTKSNDPSQELKHKLESGEKIKASELASEFIHFIQEESRGSGGQDLKKQEQKGEHQSFVHIAEEGVKTIVRRLSQTIEDMKEKLHSSREGSATEKDEQHPHYSFKEIALGLVHEIQDDMTLKYDKEYMHTSKPHSKSLEKKLEKFISHTKPSVETGAETQPSKTDEIASTHQINPAELKGFTTVKSGKSGNETKPQQEEKETKKEEEQQNLLSSSKNPFDILMEDDNLNVVAGEGVGADITNKAQENEPSSFTEKAKEKIENVSSKISNKMHAAKSKASATFKEADKENAPQVASKQLNH